MSELQVAQVPKMKTRDTERYNKKQKKKYFRETKVYQNDYIMDIQERGQIRHFHSEREEHDPDQCVLYLFFCEKREYFLLLGRGEAKDYLLDDSQAAEDDILKESVHKEEPAAKAAELKKEKSKPEASVAPPPQAQEDQSRNAQA